MVQSTHSSSRGLRFGFKKHVFVVVAFVWVWVCSRRKGVFPRQRQTLHRGVACYFIASTLFLSSRVLKHLDEICLERRCSLYLALLNGTQSDLCLRSGRNRNNNNKNQKKPKKQNKHTKRI